MLKTIEGVFTKQGKILLKEPFRTKHTVKVLITILEESPVKKEKLNLPEISVGVWPENLSLRREDIYENNGR